MGLIEFRTGDCREVLKTLPEASVQAVVTSPPYFGLRSYDLEPTVWGVTDPDCEHEWDPSAPVSINLGLNRDFNERWGNSSGQRKQEGELIRQAATRFEPGTSSYCRRCGAWRGQLGLEPHIGQFVANIAEVFREVWRVLRPDGLAFLNISDSYATNGGAHRAGSYDGGTGCAMSTGRPRKVPPGLRSKSLCLIPQRVAIALSDDGWIVRNWLIWWKRNILPTSVRDRFTNDFEPILMLAKSERPFFDMEPVREPASGLGAKGSKFNKGKTAKHQLDRSSDKEREERLATRQPRAVWDIPCQPFPGEHLATFPEALAERALLCSTSEHGCCMGCGAPYRRIVEKGAPLEEWKQACGADSEGGYNGTAQKNYEEAGAQNASATKARILAGMVERRTVGWTPTCKCLETPDFKIVDAVARLLDPDYRGPVEPCTVLDCFSGSGTTGLVAKRLGRRAILVDQSEQYVSMSKKRCGISDD